MSVDFLTGIFVFQSAPPRRERSELIGQAMVAHIVSIRAPAKGAMSNFAWTAARHRSRLGFNPRPREGSDLNRKDCRRERFSSLVSIRAPAKGAMGPLLSGYGYVFASVSIRAPAKGAMGQRWHEYLRSSRSFNPRPREGSDLRKCPGQERHDWFQSAPPRRERFADDIISWVPTGVSIRAPAKGAIGSVFTRTIAVNQFQSAPPRRERLGYSCSFPSALLFQSAPPRRERCFLPAP